MNWKLPFHTHIPVETYTDTSLSKYIPDVSCVRDLSKKLVLVRIWSFDILVSDYNPKSFIWRTLYFVGMEGAPQKEFLSCNLHYHLTSLKPQVAYTESCIQLFLHPGSLSNSTLSSSANQRISFLPLLFWNKYQSYQSLPKRNLIILLTILLQ